MHLFQHLIATLNKQLTATRVIILIKYAVVCNMPFNVHLFLFSWLWIYLDKIINYVLKVWTKNDFAVLQTLEDRKFQGKQVGLKSQPFSMWLEAKLLRHCKFSSG